MPEFVKWQHTLEEMGYRNFWKKMNAKDYGVPQNRDRVFMVSILDKDSSFFFPDTMKLQNHIENILEQDVDERYFISDKKVDEMLDKIRERNEKDSATHFFDA